MRSSNDSTIFNLLYRPEGNTVQAEFKPPACILGLKSILHSDLTVSPWLYFFPFRFSRVSHKELALCSCLRQTEGETSTVSVTGVSRAESLQNLSLY